MNRIIKCNPQEIAKLSPAFEDSRLPEMFFRYKARNYHDQLSLNEQDEWQEYRRNKLNDLQSSQGLGFAEFDHLIAEIRQRENISENDNTILNEIETYRFELQQSL